jgi:replication factor C subunit 3/5
LNASDERGIDIIRNQIHSFVRSLNLFESGFKFVILDEVDYMTKTAQQALKYLLQTTTTNVRFCLICNYISKIDETLQSYFMKMNFNHLPHQKMVDFLLHIARLEALDLTETQAQNVCRLYNSDVRSMINYLQLNKEGNKSKDILSTDVWDELYRQIQQGDNINVIMARVERISQTYNTDSVTLMKDFLNYAVLKFDDLPLQELSALANAIHGNAPPKVLTSYVLLKLLKHVF